MIAGGIGAAVFESASFRTPQNSTAPKMAYRTLANGTVVYEQVSGADQEANIVDIAPAAGPDTQPQFKYDPLTQTYRRSTVDIQGNPSQDVINTNN